jgi:chaperonin cofactor prefoldin
MAKRIASKQQPKKSLQAITKGEMEHLLADQASMILNAAGERLSAQEKRSNIRLEKMEERFAKRLDELTKTLDRFLKRLSDIEEEFIFMKAGGEAWGRAGLSRNCASRRRRYRVLRSLFV